MTNFNSVPTAVIGAIGGYLEDNDLHQVGQVSKLLSNGAKTILAKHKGPALLKMEEMCKRLSSFIQRKDDFRHHCEDPLVSQLYTSCRELSPPEQLKYYKVMVTFICFRKDLEHSNKEFLDLVRNEIDRCPLVNDKVAVCRRFINQITNYNRPILSTAIYDFTSIPPIEGYRFVEEPIVVEILLKLGADPNGKADGRETGFALHTCLGFDKIKTLHLLMKNGAKPDLQDEQGTTPLHHVASLTGEDTLLKAFIHYLPNPFIINAHGRTPKDTAQDSAVCGRDHSAQIATLEEYEKQFRAHTISVLVDKTALPKDLAQIVVDHTY